MFPLNPSLALQNDRCAVKDDGSCDFVSLGNFTDKSGKIGEVSVIQCRHCKHAISLPAIPDVAFLYDNRESQDFQPDSYGLARWIKNIAFRRQARKLLKQLGITPNKLLDFGCGNGHFTRSIRGLLPYSHVIGSDFFNDPPKELIGLRYTPITQLAPLEGSFDVVSAMHVLEHDDDVAGLLAQISRMVKRGGRLVIEVPNVDCLWSKLFGRHWDAWYLPYHRSHFSRASLAQFLEHNGLEILSIHAISVPTMGRTFANIFRSRNNLFWLLLGVSLHPVQWLGEKLTGRSSAIRIISKKNHY